MAGGDWVRLYRAMLDHPVMQDDFLCRLWNWCLLKANYKPQRWKNTVIHPGQFVTGRITASEELKCSPSRWYRGIMRLQELGCIEIEANSNWTTLTICNWRSYQSDSDGDRTAFQKPNSKWTTLSDGEHGGYDSEGNPNRTANEQPLNTRERRKERKKESPNGDSQSGAEERRISLPENINTVEFRAAWADWIAHRREIKKPLTPTQAAALVRKFSRWGPERSIAAIVFTIEKGWQGLKEPDCDERPGTNHHRPSGGGSRGTPNSLERAQQREDQQLEILRRFAESDGGLFDADTLLEE